ncbi:MAG: DNA alkylation repair enzyme [Methanocella sp. PtaU1.Bin125]|nr:MAG: DNA alkylation repair enzyme [Methanocella sp. PtaU1.Bin125]
MSAIGGGNDRDRYSPIIADVRAFCAASANAENVKKYSRYFKEGYDAYGLGNEKMDELEDALVAKYGDNLALPDVIALGHLLMASGKYEEASIAIRLARRYKKAFGPADFEALGAWLDRGICNWGHTDVLSGDLLSHFLLRGIVGPDRLRPWTASSSRWKRRAVPVTLIPYAKKAADIGPLLEIVRPLMGDRERVVHQGTGWFLREAWKKFPGPVETFLVEYKDTSPRLIYQYATEKMGPEQKALFKAAKKKTQKK